MGGGGNGVLHVVITKYKTLEVTYLHNPNNLLTLAEICRNTKAALYVQYLRDNVQRAGHNEGS